jgi:hypothetical protein
VAKALSGGLVHVLSDSGPGGERVLLVRCTDVDENDTVDLSAYFQKIIRAVMIVTGGVGPTTVTPGAGVTIVTLTTGSLANDVAWVLVYGVSAVA